MKKILAIILLSFLLLGCSKNSSASLEVKKYLDNYRNLSKNVTSNLDKVIDENDEFNTDNKKMYKKLLLKQYKNLKYTILTEDYDDDKALITVNIEVYDLNKSEEEAENYLAKNLKEFYNDKNEFDNTKYINYKLKLIYDSSSKVNYNIVFLLKQKNNEWVLEQPTDEDLEKIHGIYKNNN